MNNNTWYQTRFAKLMIRVVACIIVGGAIAFMVSNTTFEGFRDDWWKPNPIVVVEGEQQ